MEDQCSVADSEGEEGMMDYNPNGISPGQRVRIFTGAQGWDFTARVQKIVTKKTHRKAIAFLEHNLEGYPVFVDVADCYPLSGPLYPGHHHNG